MEDRDIKKLIIKYLNINDFKIQEKLIDQVKKIISYQASSVVEINDYYYDFLMSEQKYTLKKTKSNNDLLRNIT